MPDKYHDSDATFTNENETVLQFWKAKTHCVWKSCKADTLSEKTSSGKSDEIFVRRRIFFLDENFLRRKHSLTKIFHRQLSFLDD